MAGRKMKRNMNCPIRQKSEWVSIEFNPNEFEDLNGVEELTDYELVRENSRINSPKHNRKKAKICLSSKEHKDNSTNNNRSSYAMQKSSMNVSDKKKEQKRKPGKKHKKQKGKNYGMPLSVKVSEKSQVDMSAWNDCFVPEPVKRALSELGFSYPTPIQALTLPSAIRDKLDILGAAETGSGKTLAFGIPLIHFILEEKTLEMNKCENEKDLVKPLRALVITPTRELAVQVRNHLRMAAKYTDIKIEAIVGGMCLQKQERLLRLRPDIVVATPGRLWELIEEGNPHLSQISEIRMLVVDEADRMAEKGHFAELLQIVELINKSGSTSRKTYIFSATLTLVHDVPKRILLKRKKFKMTQEKKVEHLTSIFGVNNKYKVIDLSRKVGTVESLTESRIHCSLQEKDVYLCYFLMTHPGRTLIFCNSIDCVRRLKSILTILDYSPYPLHASMHQRQRLKNLDRFTSDSKGILLATDVAARGLDIVGIEHIIHYQIPHTAEVYVHRSGRTARAERQGHSLMLIEPKEIVYYRHLCKSLNRDEDVPVAQVNNFVLRAMKERIALARIIDKLEHSQRKSAAHNNWLLNAAREIDVEVDDNELMTVNQPKQELTVLKKRLKIVMQKPILQMTL